MQQRTQGLVDETHFNISIQEAQFSHLSLALMVSSPALLPSSKYIALSLFSHFHSLWLSLSPPLSLLPSSLRSLPPSLSPHYSLIQAVQSLTTTHTQNKKATTSGLMSKKKKKNKCPCCPACLPGSAGKRMFVSLVIKTPAGFQLPPKPACVLSFVLSFSEV